MASCQKISDFRGLDCKKFDHYLLEESLPVRSEPRPESGLRRAPPPSLLRTPLPGYEAAGGGGFHTAGGSADWALVEVVGNLDLVGWGESGATWCGLLALSKADL